ncbi:MAG: iron-containing alcohol dehydrogenase [Prevotellaceae bacterium]|jgi:NADP-dependent alcohol dehydrogenase|nr:iron-containing alcohol dehydrogenase [Prevotellaceae bacterium]
MYNFSYINPTKLIFGAGQIEKLKTELPADAKILIVYGGGSIKHNGVYQQIINALQGFEYLEFSGIEPNPHYETCMEAVEIIRREQINFLLAAGGGSVIDAAKFMAAAALFKGDDPWQIVEQGLSIESALPLCTVLTLPATGSEMNGNSVITRDADRNKLGWGSLKVYPVFSILDPETTYTLPPKQIGNGVVDTFVHTTEQYLTFATDAKLQDGFAETILRTLIAEGPKALQTPRDYNVRANLMFASTMALNGLIGTGVPQDWATHGIGHELTARYGLDHGQTLAIVLPGALTVLREQKGEKIAQCGRNVFGINEQNIDTQIDKTISAIENFFEEMGISTHLSQYGITEEAADAVSARLAERGWLLGEKQNITPQMVKTILLLRK